MKKILLLPFIFIIMSCEFYNIKKSGTKNEISEREGKIKATIGVKKGEGDFNQNKIGLSDSSKEFNFKKSIFYDEIDVEYSMTGPAPMSVTCGDIDNDNDLDIIVATKSGIIIYENQLKTNKN